MKYQSLSFNAECFKDYTEDDFVKEIKNNFNYLPEEEATAACKAAYAKLREAYPEKVKPKSKQDKEGGE